MLYEEVLILKIICVQPAQTRFKWEIKVLLKNLYDLGFDLKDVILLFTKNMDFDPKDFEKYGCEVHEYFDKRSDKSYIPSIQPYLWYRFLEEDKTRENETYFYIDSDVIFRELPDFSKLPIKPNVWVGSDCNNYLNMDYLKWVKNSDLVLKTMANVIGVSIDSIATINHDSIGAQRILCQPTVEYMKKVYEDDNKLYNALNPLDTNLQKWTAGMWSEIWNMLYFNISPLVNHELDFSWATDDISNWNKNKIYHNAGVTSDNKELFFKGAYLHKEPFNDDFSFVNKNKCSYVYVKAIQKAKDF